jgi:hypothetical protein
VTSDIFRAIPSENGQNKIGRVKLTCRITPNAKKKLAQEAARIKSAKPPYGELISPLIQNCSDQCWAQITENLPLKSGKPRQDHYRRMREKIEDPENW